MIEFGTLLRPSDDNYDSDGVNKIKLNSYQTINQ